MITITTTYDRLCALDGLYQQTRIGYRPDNPHEQLLYEHLCELGDRICKITDTNRRQKKYTIHLKGSEACAFLQLWHQTVGFEPYTSIAVNSVIEQINKWSLQTATQLSLVTPKKSI